MSLLAEGVEYAAATDHNIVTDYAPAIAALDAARASAVRRASRSRRTRGGTSIATRTRGPTPPYAGTPAEIFGAVRGSADHALIQVNHPRMGDIGYFNRARLDCKTGSADAGGFSYDFDVIEVFNGFERDLPTIEGNLQDWYGLLASGRRYTAVGNSDSHRLVTQWAGYPRTYVALIRTTPRESARAR